MTTHNTAPRFPVLGRYDYAVRYEAWSGIKEKIPHLAYELFDRSAPFPMLEESARFDERLIGWLAKGR